MRPASDKNDFGSMDDLYREVILDHYREPCGRAPIEGANVHGEGLNPVCGDECQIEARLADGKVEALQVAGRGCSISVASGSILAQLATGRTVAEVERLIEIFRLMMHGEPPPEDVDLGDLEVLAGIKDYPVRVKCALLAWKTLAGGLTGARDQVTTE
jgi:nitrogen fixation NifU-like protein